MLHSRRIISLLISLLSICSLQAQTKIFKEVGEDMSTQVKAIIQDNTLVGYLAFTRLERSDADSFNYRLTIMDENLHDIGKVEFRQQLLDLQTVAFEQNVLCLGYVQSPLAGGESVRTRRDYKKAQSDAISSHVMLQFINLDGKVINTFYREVDLKTATVGTGSTWSGSARVVGYLKYGMQIRNIPGSGFCLFYGFEMKQALLAFDIKGSLTHEQEVTAYADHYFLRTSSQSVYLLTKDNNRSPEGGCKLFVYAAQDLNAENNFELRDADGNWLKVLSIDNDPVTGDAFIAGCIINTRRERAFFTAIDYTNSPYIGLFTLDLGGPGRDMHANCSYWSTQNFPGIDKDGAFTDQGFYVKYATAFRDYHGNTIFAGAALIPSGSARFRLADGVFVRQEAAGKLVLDNSIPCDETKSFGPTGMLYSLDKKDFYKVVNADTKTNFMIIDDEQNIYIYNVNTRKVVRTIQHKDGNVKTNVYPAKEGYVMVSEYNRKEKQTRFSIEAL